MGDSYIEPNSPMQCFEQCASDSRFSAKGPESASDSRSSSVGRESAKDGRSSSQGSGISSLINFAKFCNCQKLGVHTDPDYDDYDSYLLCHGHLGDVKALRVLIKVLTAQEVSVLAEHFRLELRAALSMKHNNILKAHGWAHVLENNVAIIHEYMPRDTLYSMLQLDNYDSCHRIVHSIDLASVIMYLHEERILHRNIRSGALLYDLNAVKLASFVLAKFPKDGRKRTELIQIPNQIDNPEYIRRGVVTRAFDVYCFGMVLLEMATRLDAPTILDILCFWPDRRNEMEAAVERFDSSEMERILNAGLCCALPTSSQPRPPLKQIEEYLRRGTRHAANGAILSFIEQAPQPPGDFIPAQIPEQFDIGIPPGYPSDGALNEDQRAMIRDFLRCLKEHQPNLRFTRLEELIKCFTRTLVLFSVPLEDWNVFAQFVLRRSKQFEVFGASYEDDYQRLLSEDMVDDCMEEICMYESDLCDA